MNVEDDFVAGYRDGRDRDAPEPSANRSAAYRHSFNVGRAEIEGRPIPAALSRARAREAEAEEAAR